MPDYYIPLSRALEYTEREDVDFVRKSEIRNAVDALFAEHKISGMSGIRITSLQFFNEAEYILAKLLASDFPGDTIYNLDTDLRARLTDDEVAFVWTYASEISLLMEEEEYFIRMHYAHCKNSPRKINLMIQRLDCDKTRYARQIYEVIDDLLPGESCPDFPELIPTPASRLKQHQYKWSDWKEVTHNFSESKVRAYIALQPSIEEKRILFGYVCTAFNEWKCQVAPLSGGIGPGFDSAFGHMNKIASELGINLITREIKTEKSSHPNPHSLQLH